MVSTESLHPTRLAIISSHPIQAQVPWFVALSASQEIELRVYYTLLPDEAEQGQGFGVSFAWDIPMLDGYAWELLKSASSQPHLKSFFGNRLTAVSSAIKAFRPDIVVLTGWQNLGLVQALFACSKLGIPCLIRGVSNSMRPRPWFVRQCHQHLFRLFDGFLAVGRSNRDFYLDNNVDESRIFRCPYSVDNDRFVAQATQAVRERAKLRASWGIGPVSCCFLFVGKLIGKKRVLDLIDAFNRTSQEGGDLHLLVVGDGDLKQRALRLAEPSSGAITFAGFLNQSEIAQAYVASDCLVLPSDYGETWGLVVNEAMACGIPAIVSDRVGCGPDLVEDSVTGFVFPFGDTGALAEMLLAAASDAERLREMGKNARRRVTKKYSIKCEVDSTLAAINAIRAR